MFPLACTGRRGRAQPIFQSHRNHKAQSPDIFQVIQSGFDQVDADNLICKKPEWTMINSIQLHNYYASTEFEQMLSVENIIACQATSRFYELLCWCVTTCRQRALSLTEQGNWSGLISLEPSAS